MSRRFIVPFRFPCGRSLSSGPREQGAQPDQVVRRCVEGEDPIHQYRAAMVELAQQSDGLHPPEGLFDQLSFSLTDRVSGVTRRAAIDRAAATIGLRILRDVRRDIQLARLSDKVARVVVLVAAERRSTPIRQIPSIVSAASRSAVPVAAVTSASTIKPCRFSVRRCPK